MNDTEQLYCDFCGAQTDDPWHTSDSTRRHLHQCAACHAASDQHRLTERNLIAALPKVCKKPSSDFEYGYNKALQYVTENLRRLFNGADCVQIDTWELIRSINGGGAGPIVDKKTSEEIMEGTFECPICGKDTPHEHSGAENAQHTIITKLRGQSLWAAEHGIWKGSEVTRIFTHEGVGGTQLIHAADIVAYHNNIVEQLLAVISREFEKQAQRGGLLAATEAK